MVLGAAVVDPIRDQFNLEDPSAGIYFSSNQPMTDGEAMAGMFLNSLLRYRFDQAREQFEQLEEAAVFDGENDLRGFLGFILAMASAR